MKSEERHKLKENELARSVIGAGAALEGRRRDITLGVTVVVVLLAIVGGYTWWRQSRADSAGEALGTALAVYEAPVVPPAPVAPGSAPPVQQAGTFLTQQAKLEAALPKFIEAADKYPTSGAGIAARYHAAGILATLGRYSEAEQQYQNVVSRAGTGIYSETAKLGLADAQVAQQKYDSAIAIYTELSRNSQQMPLDGVLMQLGRAYTLAGKKSEATSTFTRVTTDFPQSTYAADAQRELDAAKKS
jgi:TolA-binding protein